MGCAALFACPCARGWGDWRGGKGELGWAFGTAQVWSGQHWRGHARCSRHLPMPAAITVARRHGRSRTGPRTAGVRLRSRPAMTPVSTFSTCSVPTACRLSAPRFIHRLTGMQAALALPSSTGTCSSAPGGGSASPNTIPMRRSKTMSARAAPALPEEPKDLLLPSLLPGSGRMTARHCSPRAVRWTRLACRWITTTRRAHSRSRSARA